MSRHDNDQEAIRFEFFSSERAFWSAFNQLNALCGKGWRWEAPRARKRHVDLFGDEVEEGETYFKKQYAAAFDAVIKLSMRSMEKLLYAVIQTTPETQAIADVLRERALEEMREMMETLEEPGKSVE